MNGEMSLVESNNKEAVTALREIASGQVEFDRPINDLLQDGIR
jgi:DNA-directed RNA polymerase subunit K/omega